MSLSVTPSCAAQTPTVALPRICKPILQGGQSTAMLVPLAGISAQGATPYTSEWLPVGAGAFLQLTLVIARLTGTLSVILETVAQPETDPPRFCAAFLQTHGTGKGKITVVSDAFVRVVATPGAGTGQVADWTITGQAILPGAPRM